MTVLQDCGFDDTTELYDLDPQEEVLLTGLLIMADMKDGSRLSTM